jgi:pyruvate formate lyase activating enzyme
MSIEIPKAGSKGLLGSRFDLRVDNQRQTEDVQADGTGQSGWIHSWETGGTVDGPGVRFVLFLSGCLLRCQYCHNPDTWHMKHGQKVLARDVLAEIERYRPFLIGCGGGVTISGGEPLLQPKFLATILRGCKKLDLHTAVDTAGLLGDNMNDEMLRDTDLVLLDIKSWDPDTYRRLTSQPLEPTLDFARRLSALGKRIWLRFVLVPGLTDDYDNVEGIARFASGLGNVERLEVLPFHKMGEGKWDALGLDYQLKGTQPPDPSLLYRVHQQFKDQGLMVV